MGERPTHDQVLSNSNHYWGKILRYFTILNSVTDFEESVKSLLRAGQSQKPGKAPGLGSQEDQGRAQPYVRAENTAFRPEGRPPGSAGPGVVAPPSSSSGPY